MSGERVGELFSSWLIFQLFSNLDPPAADVSCFSLVSSVESDSLIGGFLTPSDIEEGKARYAWSTGGDGGSPQKNLIKVKFCPHSLVHLQGERERSVVDGGRQANATSAASDPLLFPTQPFSQDTALLGRELCALAGLVCFPDQPPIPPPCVPRGQKQWAM